MTSLASLYDALQHQDEQPAAAATALWDEWLWGCDCNAPPMERLFDFNEMHGLGLLVCLHERRRCADARYHAPTALPGGPSVVHLFPDRPVSSLSIRETLDQLECLQLHWGPVLLRRGDDDEPLRALRALMARLGELAHHAYPIGAELDDPQHITQLPLCTSHRDRDEGEVYGIVSRKTLRQAICLLLALCRVHAIAIKASTPDPAAVARFRTPILRALRMHHVESSQDLFDTLQQMVYLAPGQRLAYRTLFSGMYNSVSQVVYFHHPRFSRQPQFPSLAQIPSSAMHMLPLITQLLPDIDIFYDDDTHVPLFMPSLVAGAAAGTIKWAWLVACGAFFLVDVERDLLLAPAPECDQPLLPLVAHYLLHNPTISILGAAEEDGEAEDEAGDDHSSSHGAPQDTAANHVCFVTSAAAPPI